MSRDEISRNEQAVGSVDGSSHTERPIWSEKSICINFFSGALLDRNGPRLESAGCMFEPDGRRETASLARRVRWRRHGQHECTTTRPTRACFELMMAAQMDDKSADKIIYWLSSGRVDFWRRLANLNYNKQTHKQTHKHTRRWLDSTRTVSL
jgi:hypothetical protein